LKSKRIRGADVGQGGLFSCVSLESRVPPNHPLRGVRLLLDEALAEMSTDFDRVYAKDGSSVESAGAIGAGVDAASVVFDP
jgi:hypothetical protein